MIEIIKKDPFVQLVTDLGIKDDLIIVGGAVVDILDGRKVKDYDLLHITNSNVEKLGLEYQYETRTARTYTKNGFTVQILKTELEDFDFKISQSRILFDRKGVSLLIDKNSFDNKVLIPCEKTWSERKNALNSLRRIPHWVNKGYTIHDMTYLSLLSAYGKDNNINS